MPAVLYNHDSKPEAQRCSNKRRHGRGDVQQIADDHSCCAGQGSDSRSTYFMNLLSSSWGLLERDLVAEEI
jgi:hypothetical protein